MRSENTTCQSVQTTVAPAATRPTLYSVPRRAVPRAAWVPTGRTLHLIDIENLMGGPLQGVAALDRAIHNYRSQVGIGFHDQVVVACNGALALDAGLAWNGSRILIGHGPDGADLALLKQLEDAQWVAARYDRVVVGSGDGIFAEAVSRLTGLGIATGVASTPRSLSCVLAEAATFVVWLPDAAEERGVA